MATSGPNNPGTLADDSAVGAETWTNPSGAASSNNVYAYVSKTLGGTAQTHYLKATNFGFAIPDGATITQVLFEVEKFSNGLGGVVYDTAVYMLIGGATSGSNLAIGGNWTTSSDTYVSYTITSGLPTVAQVNASNFGLVLSATLQKAGPPPTTVTGSVDHIRCTVTYTGGDAPANAPREAVCFAPLLRN